MLISAALAWLSLSLHAWPTWRDRHITYGVQGAKSHDSGKWLLQARMFMMRVPTLAKVTDCSQLWRGIRITCQEWGYLSNILGWFLLVCMYIQCNDKLPPSFLCSPKRQLHFAINWEKAVTTLHYYLWVQIAHFFFQTNSFRFASVQHTTLKTVEDLCPRPASINITKTSAAELWRGQSVTVSINNLGGVQLFYTLLLFPFSSNYHLRTTSWPHACNNHQEV